MNLRANRTRSVKGRIETPDRFLKGWHEKTLPPSFHAYAWRLYRALKLARKEADGYRRLWTREIGKHQ